MKKLLTALSCAAILASTASADFARVELGGGMWNKKPTGTLTYTDGLAKGTYTSKEKDDSSAYAWLLIKHPIPVLPNIRVEYANLKDEGLAEGSFDGFTAPANSEATLEMTQYDVIPYYNILDNTFWMTVDLGLDFKITEIKYAAESVDVSGLGTLESYSDTTSLVIPLVYARARVQIPTTGIGIETDLKYVSYEKNTVSDFRVKIDYTLDITPLIQPGIEIGYRIQSFDLTSDDEKTKIKMDYSGLYAGIMLRF